jgi:hypothetical protein
MPSHVTPLILTMAISALSVTANAQQAPVPAQPNQIIQNQQVTQPMVPIAGTSPFTQTTLLSDVRLNHVLGLPTSHCGHMIDLLHSNRVRQGLGQLGDFPQTYSLPHEIAGAISGDLELSAVYLVSDGTPSCGPVFDIALCNHSRVAIGSFRISIVGVLGCIQVHSPTTTIRVSGMNVGQQLHVQMQLPVTCMTMGPAGTQPAPFDTLVVAIDSFDEWVERVELNNVRVISRPEIGLLIAEIPVAVTTAPDVRAEAEPAQEPTDAAPSPLDSFDFDDLDLDSADESAIRFGAVLR